MWECSRRGWMEPVEMLDEARTDVMGLSLVSSSLAFF